MFRLTKLSLVFAAAAVLFCCCGGNQPYNRKNMCEKQPMQADGIVRLSKIDVNPDYLEEYMQYAMEVGTVSLETEPGVLTMYAVADKENPCHITILETYASQEAYKRHIASDHFQKYKQGTLHMVDSLVLDDVLPLNPANKLINFIDKR
ncbi:MAG: antibiotic biosynthesis monooxygenase [Muribaculaceae bacterium]|nr:antibiotic biosynthesis monooxygenase [Muribaculaceae bacterium]